jgi:hypothetical protein
MPRLLDEPCEPQNSVANVDKVITGDDPVNLTDPTGDISAGTICGEDGSGSPQCAATKSNSAQVVHEECTDNPGACESGGWSLTSVISTVTKALTSPEALTAIGVAVSILALATGVGAVADIGYWGFTATELGTISSAAGTPAGLTDLPECLKDPSSISGVAACTGAITAD